MSDYCQKIQQCVDGVLICLHRSSGALTGRPVCKGCTIEPFLKPYIEGKYRNWPQGLTLNHRYNEEIGNQMGCVFDKEGKLITKGTMVAIPGSGEWVEVTKVNHNSGALPDEVFVKMPDGTVGVFSPFMLKVVLPPKEWKKGDLVASAANRNIRGTVTGTWKRRGDKTKWVMIDTCNGSRVERADLLMPYEGDPEDLARPISDGPTTPLLRFEKPATTAPKRYTRPDRPAPTMPTVPAEPTVREESIRTKDLIQKEVKKRKGES